MNIRYPKDEMVKSHKLVAASQGRKDSRLRYLNQVTSNISRGQPIFRQHGKYKFSGAIHREFRE